MKFTTHHLNIPTTFGKEKSNNKPDAVKHEKKNKHNLRVDIKTKEDDPSKWTEKPEVIPKPEVKNDTEGTAKPEVKVQMETTNVDTRAKPEMKAKSETAKPEIKTESDVTLRPELKSKTENKQEITLQETKAKPDMKQEIFKHEVKSKSETATQRSLSIPDAAPKHEAMPIPESKQDDSKYSVLKNNCFTVENKIILSKIQRSESESIFSSRTEDKQFGGSNTTTDPKVGQAKANVTIEQQNEYESTLLKREEQAKLRDNNFEQTIESSSSMSGVKKHEVERITTLAAVESSLQSSQPTSPRKLSARNQYYTTFLLVLTRI